MTNTVVWKQKSTPKIEFEERKRILFHIESLQGLPRHGWQPIASTFVSVESQETGEILNTECKKSSPLITWGENMPILHVKASSKVRFEVKSKGLWNKTLLGMTDTFEIRDLMKMQGEVGEERSSFINLVVNTHTPDGSENSHKTILSLSIREMAAPNLNVILMAEDVQRLVDQCQEECLTELSLLGNTIDILRKTTFAEETNLLCLLDMILGTAEGVQKIIANPKTMNTNKLTVACCEALSNAFLPYQSISSRKLGKRGETQTAVVKDMLCGTIRALESIERVLRIPTHCHYEKHQLEQRQIAWTRYFEFQKQSFLDDGTSQTVDAPLNTTVKRIQCPYRMVANDVLPFNSKGLAMDLPVTDSSGAYERPDLVRHLGEWIFSRSFSDNGASELNQKPHKIFCLVGLADTEKTQLISRVILWLREMKCLGGFFSFDGFSTRNSRQLLNALPITIIHQACTVQPDIVQKINQAYASNDEAACTALEDYFDRFFAEPMLKFEEERGNRAWRLWNPVDQLVFVIDGLDSQVQSLDCPLNESDFGEGQYDQHEEQTFHDFVNFFASSAVSKLPSYVKFLILCRRSTGIGDMFKERGVGYVHELDTTLQLVDLKPSISLPRDDSR